MKRALIWTSTAALLGAALAAAAQPSPEVLSKYRTLMDKVEERLAVISETSKGRDEKELGKLIKTLESMDKSLAEFAPDSELKTTKQRLDSLVRLSLEGKAKGNLGSLRASLAIYYGDTEGKYPKDPKALVPKYLPEIPALELPDHPASNEIIVLTDAKGDKIDPYIKDTGKWLYISNPDSPLDGTLVIDCNHKDAKGRLWYQF
jgi:hypothetical protein